MGTAEPVREPVRILVRVLGRASWILPKVLLSPQIFICHLQLQSTPAQIILKCKSAPGKKIQKQAREKVDGVKVNSNPGLNDNITSFQEGIAKRLCPVKGRNQFISFW